MNEILERTMEQNEQVKYRVIEDVLERSRIKDKRQYIKVTQVMLDSGGAAGETYKSLFEKTASHLTNNNQKGFSTESLQKNSDKINYEVKDNARRFLQKMIRNIESY